MSGNRTIPPYGNKVVATTAVVVNEDPTQLSFLSDLLRKAGLTPLGFNTAAAALEGMNGSAPAAGMDTNTVPAIIVTDLYMPGIDGWRFCRLLRSPQYAAFNQVPILVVSDTFAGDAPYRITTDLGVKCFLHTPVNGERFVEQVDAILKGRLVSTPVRVLIVEDSAALAEKLKIAFKSHGYQAKSVPTARMATEAFAQTLYDVALLDYILPDGTGDILLDIFREQRPDCVCLMMTTNSDPALALDWMKRGAAAYLHKPFEPEYLMDLCARARRERALLRVQELLEVRTRELRQSERLLREAHEIARLGRWELDLATGRLIWSEGIYNLFEIDRDIVTTSYDAFLEIVHPDDRDLVNRAYSASVQKKKLYEIEHRLLMTDGRIKWVSEIGRTDYDADGHPIRSVGTVQEITERKRAEEALGRSEKNYQELFNHSPVGIFVTDSMGKPHHVNPEMARIVGASTPEEFLKKYRDLPTRFYADPERRKVFIAQLQAQGKVENFEFEARHLSGAGIWLSMNARINDRFADGTFLIDGFIVDITDRKRTEDEQKIVLDLLDHLNRTSGLHELMGNILELLAERLDLEAVGIRLQEGDDFPYFETRGFPAAFVQLEKHLCELDNQGKLLRDQQGNPVLACMCGNVICGRTKPGLPFFTPNGSFWTNSTTDLLSSSSDQERQARTRNRCNGEGYESVALVPLRYGAQVLGLLQFNDARRGRFTQEKIALLEHLASNLSIGLVQRRTAEELRKSEEKYRLIFEHSPLGLLSFDENGIIVACNDNFVRIIGSSREVLVGLNMLALPNQKMVSTIRQALSGSNGLFEGIYQSVTADKTTPVRAFFTPITSKSGQCQGGVGLIEDISERRRAEEEQEKLKAQLHQAQKMESVGRLAGGVAHDFNNMLNVILGYTELALESTSPAQQLHGHLLEIQKAALQSADLTQQLLAFARRQTIAPKVLELNHIVESMLKMLRRMIGEDIDLIWRPGRHLWPLKMDPSQIDQILANLCVNARDAIAGVGKITIETANTRFDEAYCAVHPGFVAGEYVRLAMSDNGTGMEKDTLDKLFEPFFTTKEVGKGTGLGLATVYGIVKQNNGFINVYSKPNQGTTFEICLPPHKEKAQQKRKEASPTAEARGHETILLVEDEPSILRMTALMLERQGYTVLAAATPGEAIRLAEVHPGIIDLLMTDVVMPEMNGRQLAKNLRLLYPNLLLLFMSGYTADVIAHHGVLDPGVHFIQKPFSKNGLAAKVREVLDSE